MALLLQDWSERLTTTRAVDAADSDDAELRQIDRSRSGASATRLPRDRLLCRVERASLAGTVRRRPQTGANRELAALRTTDDANHAAGVLPDTLTCEPISAAGGLVDRERSGGAWLIAHTADEFDRIA